MKKLLFAISYILGFIFLTACISKEQAELETVTIMANFPQFTSIEHLASDSTNVVRVEVIDERVEFINIWIPPENELEETGEDLQYTV